MSIPQTVAGIDVAQAASDIVIMTAEERCQAFSTGNDPAGLDEMIRRLKKSRVELVVLEATGGLEMPNGWVAVISKATVDSLMPTEADLKG